MTRACVGTGYLGARTPEGQWIWGFMPRSTTLRAPRSHATPVTKTVELEIPARPEFVALARLVVSAMASTDATLSDDQVDDLKIAVSEACTNAIEAHDAIATDERVL